MHAGGAFGQWAAAPPRPTHLVEGCTAVDSWATDAGKTLNVPNDCGIAIIAHPRAVRDAIRMDASHPVHGQGTTPEATGSQRSAREIISTEQDDLERFGTGGQQG